MFSLKSFAILALAGFASAVPVDTGAVAGLVPGLGNLPDVVGNLPGLAGGLPAIAGVPRGEIELLGDILPSELIPTLPGVPDVPGLPGLPRDTSAIDQLISVVSGDAAVPNVPRAVDPSTLTSLVSGATNNVALPGAAAGALPGAPVNLPVPRAESRSAVVIVKSVIADVQPAVDAITTIISVKADIQVDVVAQRLGDIVVVLQRAIDEVRAIVANPVGFVTSVEELATVLGLLLVVILKVLFLVSTVPALATATVAGLIATIGGLLATLLGLIIPLATGVVALLIPTIYGVVSFLYVLNLRAVVHVLGLPDLF